MVAAAIAAAAAVAGAGASIYGQMSRDNSQGRIANEISRDSLTDARNNEQYQRMVSAMINQRAVATQRDGQGSELRYDPATNTWISAPGELPKQAQNAADIAGIERNTTDMRQAQLANVIAQRRASQAGPNADTAVRELSNFRPQSSGELIGLLQKQATNAARETFDPLRADTLRSFQRSGTAAAPVLAALGKQENASLRDSLIDAQLKGMSSVGSLNQSRRQGLEQTAANASTLATPQFQYPGLNARTDDMAKTVAARAQQGAAIPAYGMGGVNTAAGLSGAASKLYAGSVPGASNSLETSGQTVSALLRNKDFIDNLKTTFGSKGGTEDYGTGRWDVPGQDEGDTF